MTEQEALQIVDELSILKFFPSAPAARGTLAIHLMDWCEGDLKRARWLVDRVDDFDEYPGPKTLRALIKDKFQPSGALAPFGRNPEVLPAAKCRECNDTGTFMVSGLHAWCLCEYGQQLRVEMPDWLDLSNRLRGTPESRIHEELRAREVQRKLAHLEAGYGTEEKAG